MEKNQNGLFYYHLYVYIDSIITIIPTHYNFLVSNAIPTNTHELDDANTQPIIDDDTPTNTQFANTFSTLNIETNNTTSTSIIQRSSSITPILPTQWERSRTPVIDLENNVLQILLDDLNRESRERFDKQFEKFEKQCEPMLVKQGKQIRALYELQKNTHKKIIWTQDQIKNQNKKNTTDLSTKVFSVSKFIFNNIVLHQF